MAKKKNVIVADVESVLEDRVTSDPYYASLCNDDTSLASLNALVNIDKARAAVTNVIEAAANAPVNIDEKNTTAAADPSLAPIPTTEAKGQRADKMARDKKEKAVDEKHAQAMTEQWEKVTALHKAGKDRPAIAKETGLPYSRLTFILWHLKYGVNAIPGMPSYSKVAKAEAQKRYDADVAKKKGEV